MPAMLHLFYLWLGHDKVLMQIVTSLLQGDWEHFVRVLWQQWRRWMSALSFCFSSAFWLTAPVDTRLTSSLRTQPEQHKLWAPQPMYLNNIYCPENKISSCFFSILWFANSILYLASVISCACVCARNWVFLVPCEKWFLQTHQVPPKWHHC